MVTIACKQCGKEFEAWPNRVRSGRVKFCSRQCKDLYQTTLTGEKSPRKGKYHTEQAIAKIQKVARKRAQEFIGEKHPQWKGGSYTNHGYRYVSINMLSAEDQEIAWPMVRKGNAYITEHRLVMARSLGRPLEKHESVHHINGNKMDNRIENLELMGASEHSRMHRDQVREIGRLKQQIAALEAENEYLRSLLTTSRRGGSNTSR